MTTPTMFDFDSLISFLLRLTVCTKAVPVHFYVDCEKKQLVL